MPLATLLATLSLAQAATGSPLDRGVEAAAAAGFAGEVLVTDRSATTFARAVSAPGRPHRPGASWRWASVTKQVTATLVMQQVSDGRLTLDETLATALPAFQGPTAKAITVRMLLQHTSGLPNPDDSPAGADEFPAFYRRTGAAVGGPSDALGYCAGAVKAAPGASFAYNNCDYLVLGAVLEQASGRPYATLLRERILAPLHLRSVGVARGDRRAPPMAPAFVAPGRLEPDFVLGTFGPAGAIYGKAEDLAAFDRGLLSGALLSAAATRIAWTGDPHLGYVALGAWSFSGKLTGCASPVRLVERRGEIGGVEVRNLIAPDLGRALVVFADRSDLDFGEIWQGRGLSYDLASGAFCAA